MRRRTALLLSLATSLAVVVGLSLPATASVSAAKAAPCAGKTKKKAIAQIKDAFDILLNGTAGRTLDERKAVVEGSEDPALLQVFTDTFAANEALAATLTVQVNSVKCTGKKAAAVDYDLVLSGAPNPDLAPPGEAVIDAKVWKVSKGSVCDLVSLANPAVLDSGPCAA